MNSKPMSFRASEKSCCAVGRVKPRRVRPAMNVSLGTNLNVPEPVPLLIVPSICERARFARDAEANRSLGVRERLRRQALDLIGE